MATIAKINDAIRKPVRCEFMVRFSHFGVCLVSKNQWRDGLRAVLA